LFSIILDSEIHKFGSESQYISRFLAIIDCGTMCSSTETCTHLDEQLVSLPAHIAEIVIKENPVLLENDNNGRATVCKVANFISLVEVLILTDCYIDGADSSGPNHYIGNFSKLLRVQINTTLSLEVRVSIELVTAMGLTERQSSPSRM